MSDTVTVEEAVEVETENAKKQAKSKTKQRSYFNTKKLNRFVLDDEVSYIEHKPLDEGLFESYQDLTSTIRLDREGETTEVDMAIGKTRKYLLESLVVGWNLVDENGDPVQFTQKGLRELPPHVIGGLVEDIYKANPILSGETAEGKDENNKTSKN